MICRGKKEGFFVNKKGQEILGREFIIPNPKDSERQYPDSAGGYTYAITDSNTAEKQPMQGQGQCQCALFGCGADGRITLFFQRCGKRLEGMSDVISIQR